jgi:hypothetical protein
MQLVLLSIGIARPSNRRNGSTAQGVWPGRSFPEPRPVERHYLICLFLCLKPDRQIAAGYTECWIIDSGSASGVDD